MNFKVFIIFYFVAASLLAQENIISTVDSVDLDKYIGTWYEIAKIPNSFQDHCIKNTTAYYEINEDGDIIVLNSCIDEDGEIDDAEGLARIVDKRTNSKLEVSFVSLLGWHIFWGDYWILGLDEDYNYVAVGTPSRKYGWILARAPQMNSEDMEFCYSVFEKNGYNRENFELSTQTN